MTKPVDPLTQRPAPSAGVVEQLTIIAAQLRSNGYADWPDWLDRLQGDIALIEQEAVARYKAELAEKVNAIPYGIGLHWDYGWIREAHEEMRKALETTNAAHQIEVRYPYERMDCSCGWQSGIRDYSQPEGDQWVERDWQNDHFLPLVVSLLAADEEAKP